MANVSKLFNMEFAMNIKRDKYLNDLINRMHNGMIKVVTGIRRCGKFCRCRSCREKRRKPRRENGKNLSRN